MRHEFARFGLGLTLAVAFVALGCQSGNAATDGNTERVPVTEAPAGALNKPDTPKIIGQGATVNLADERDPGRTTVFDFTSEYCPPCRRIAPYLEKLHDGREDVTVVKVDINRPEVRGIDWGSPTARQFGLQQIPHFKVMNQEGELIAEGNVAWDLVVKWISAMEETGSR
jgi:thiol-disulfide isomerase/thioredoxin